MSKVNQIQRKISELNGGQFQTLCDSYLSKRIGVNITSTGSQDGTDKTVKGTPDSYYVNSDGLYIFIEHTTQDSNISKKIMDDLDKCFDIETTGIPVEKIDEIIYCHTKKITPGQHLEISDYCRERNCSFENFDIGELSRDLAYYYQDVAKEELGIEIDTDQIIAPDRFIKIESETISLENKFFFREQEKEKLIDSITENDVVVLTGGAGVGKTRLAIECLSVFSAICPNYSIYCIKNRSLSLFDDFKVRMAESDKLLLFIDDANRVGNLSTILSYINENSSERRIKLILTVRNYALDLVIKRMYESHVNYERIEIDAFEPTEIEAIISSESFEIKNPYFVSRICTVSQGNARLAVMAAEVVKQSHKLEDLKDVSCIYDKYFSEVKDIVFTDGNEIAEKVLAIVAYFYSISKKNPPDRIYEKVDISETDFWDSIYKLNEHELIDLHEDSTCKISDQVLGTYFLYRVFFTKKSLDFNLLLHNYFQINIERMRETIYPIVNSFNGEAVIEYIKPSIEELYDKYLGSEEVEYLRTLSDVFYFVIPDKVLLFIQNYIDVLPGDSDQSDFDINHHGLTNDLFTLIRKVGDFGEDYLQLSIQLAIQYVLKCNSAAHQFGQYIVSGYGFERVHIDESIYRQKILFEVLIQSATENELIKEALIFAIPHFLQIQHHNSRTHGMKVTFTNFGLILTEHLKELRFILLGFMGSLSAADFLSCLDKYVDKVYYHFDIPKDEVIKAIKFDSDCLLPIIDEKITYSTLYESKIVSKYISRLNDYEITHKLIEIIQKNLKTENFMLFSILSPDRLERIEMKKEGLSVEEINRIYQSEQNDAVRKLGIAQIESFLNYMKLEVERDGPNSIWEISNSVGNLFNSLSEDYELFLDALSALIITHERMLKGLQSIPSIFFRLYSGHQRELYDLISQSEYMGKTHLKYYFLSSLPEEVIDDFYTQEIKDLFESEYLGYEIYFDNLIKYETFRTGLLLDLIRIVYENREVNGIRYPLLFNPYSEIKKNYMDILLSDEELLQDMWLYEMNLSQDIDFDGDFFIHFVEYSPEFIFRYLENLYTKDDFNRPSEFTRHPNFTRIWYLENYIEIIESVITFINSKDKYASLFNFLKTFFIVKDGKSGVDTEVVRERQKNFIELFIDKNHGDYQLMNLIFALIKSYFRDEMPDYTAQLLKLEDSKQVFDSINFDPDHYSGNGSFVPAYEDAMDFWVKLKEKLDGPDLLSARSFVAQQIDYWKRRIRNEHERNFAEKI